MDFSQISIPFRAPASDDPFRIFSTLPRVGNAPNDLWHGQAQALEQWKEHRSKSDILISLNTGAGKTLVGLLIAQSLVNEGLDNVIYACPTNDLVKQTAKQARDFGLSVTTRMESRYDNNEFELGNTFCITNYASIFNGMSSIVKNHFPGAIIFDDAHVAESIIRDSFTINIDRKASAALFAHLVSMFEPHFHAANRVSRFRDAISDSVPSRTVLIPPDIVNDAQREIEDAFRQHLDLSGPDNKFAYEHLKDHLGDCAFVFRAGRLQVSPPFLPSLALSIFSKDVRRVYLSATLGNKADVVRAFGRPPQKVIEPANDAGNGERLILFERFLSNDIKINEKFIEEIARSTKAVIAVPTYPAANKWKNVAIPPATATFSDQLQAFRDRKTGAFVLVSRVDGIDLPDETCRLMVIDGLPYGSSFIERYQHEVLSIDSFIGSRIANRIVQLFGRINRGRRDYGAFLLVGHELNMWLGRNKNVARLPVLLQNQITLGQTVQNTLNVRTLSAFKDIINKVILSNPRDEGWLSFYSQYIDASPIDKTVTDKVKKAEQRNFDAAVAEAKAAKAIWHREYSNAAAILDEIVTDVSRSDSRYAGWLNLWIGACYFSSKMGVDAGSYFDRARSQVGDGLVLVQRDYDGAVFSDPSLSKSQQHVLRYVTGTRDTHDKILTTIADQINHLGGGSSNQVEEAIRSLGSVLGFSSSRPDNDTDVGPDVFWVDESMCKGIGIEVKSDKDPGSLLNKEEVGQSLNHLEWLSRQDGIGSENLLIVGPVKGCTRNSSPSARMFLADLSSLLQISHEFVSSLKACYALPPSARLDWLKAKVFPIFSIDGLSERLCSQNVMHVDG